MDHEPGSELGEYLLTPIQRWFFELDLPERHHWNDASFLLSLQRPLRVDVLRQSLSDVLRHHDALRSRFAVRDGQWRAWIDEYDGAEPPLSTHDLSALSSQDQKDTITQVAQELQRSLDLENGPLLRLAYFDLGTRPHCLLLLAHWLVVDHYSGRILLEDMLSAYQHAIMGSPAQLPAKTTPVRRWNEALARFADSAEVAEQLPFWTAPQRAASGRILLDSPGGSNVLESLETLTVRMGLDETDALLHHIHALGELDILDIMATALVRAVPLAPGPDGGDGHRSVLLDIERHGRDTPLGELNNTRTVGRLSTLVPVLLTIDDGAPGWKAAAAVHGQLAATPMNGAGHGLLRYLSTTPGAEALRGMPTPELSLNYVGQVDEVFLRSDLLSVPRMTFGDSRSQRGGRARVLDVLAYVVASRLTLTLHYSTNLHRPESIKAIAENMERELTLIAREATARREKR